MQDTDLWDKSRAVLFYWRMAITKCMLSMFIAGGIVFLSSTTTIKWDSLGGFEKFCIVLAASIAMAKDALSFLSTTLSRLEKSRFTDAPEDGSVVVTNAGTQPQTVTVETNPSNEGKT